MSVALISSSKGALPRLNPSDKALIDLYFANGMNYRILSSYKRLRIEGLKHP